MALRMSPPATAASMISPLRTPRERAWPTPMTLRTPESLTSPTTAQILDVPTSSPTMTEDWSNMFLPVDGGFVGPGGGRRDGAGFEPHDGRVVGHRQVEGADDLADPFPEIVNQAPVAELILEAVEVEGDLAALPGGDLQHLRPGDVHRLEVHHAGHGRALKLGDQPQGRGDLGRGDGAARVELGHADARKDGQQVGVLAGKPARTAGEIGRA